MARSERGHDGMLQLPVQVDAVRDLLRLQKKLAPMAVTCPFLNQKPVSLKYGGKQIESVLSHSYFSRKVGFFRPITQNLQNFSNVGTFAFGTARVEVLPMPAIAGTVLGSGQTFFKYRTIMEIFKQTGGDANG